MSQDEYDVIVVGLGVVGSSTLWQCAKRGVRCLGIEQFSIPHVRGSSHGATRIIRSLYPESHFAEMASRSWELWDELQSETGQELVIETGGADFAPLHSDNFESLLDTCKKNHIEYTIYDKTETAENIPGLSIPDEFRVVATKKAGIIKASKSVSVLQNEAIRYGARILDNRKLVSVNDDKGTVNITIEDTRVKFTGQKYNLVCKKLIITPGAWLTPTIKSLFNLSVSSDVLQMGYYYFDTIGNDSSIYHASKFPVFIDYSEHNHHIYGTPAYEFPSMLKVGGHGDLFKTIHTTAEDRTFGVNQELLSYVQDKVRTYFPYANWKNPVHSESCLYTWTRDAEFLIDSVPDHPNVIVGGGGSGHAFKHGAAFGETLADLSLTSTSKWESHSPFKFQYHTLSSSL